MMTSRNILLTLKTETGWFFSEFYSLGVACFLEADCGEDTNFSGGIGESYKRIRKRDCFVPEC